MDLSIRLAKVASIVARIVRGGLPWFVIAITARVTSRQMPQVGAIVSNTTEPSGLTALMKQSRLL